MKFELTLERTFSHPIEKVWAALTDPDALAQWLMETDFEAEEGRRFRLWCVDGEGRTEVYHCGVLALEPPRRMVWSWLLAGREAQGPTRVEFVLEPTAAGTRLTLRHTGERDRDTVERFQAGWPYKLDQLARVLAASAPADDS